MKLQDLKILKVKIETAIDNKEKNKSLVRLFIFLHFAFVYSILP